MAIRFKGFLFRQFGLFDYKKKFSCLVIKTLYLDPDPRWPKMLNSDPDPHWNQYTHHNYDYLHLRLKLGEVGVELPDVLVHQLVGLDGDLHLVVRDLFRLLEHFLRKRRGGKINFELRIRGRKKNVFNRSFNLLSDLTLQRTNTANSNKIFPVKELRGHSPNFHIHGSVSDLYIPTINLPILQREICGPILGIYKTLTDTWMWKLGLRPRNSQKRKP